MSLYFPDPQHAASPPPTAPRHPPAKLLRLDAEFAEACRQGDRDWLLQHLADEFCCIGEDGALHGRGAFVDGCAAGGIASVLAVQDPDVQFEGDVAIVRSTVATPAARLRTTDLWIGRDGRWQLLASQRTAIAH